MYKVEFTKTAIKELSKLDKQTQRIVKHWVTKNLIGSTNPRIHGKELKGKLKGIWRYRVGDYRLFARFEDKKLIIFIFNIEHRRSIYK